MAPEYVNLQSSETASVRLEIDEFIQDNALTNLFLLALDSLMKDYGENWWSYYNIAGIHGLPAEAWNGVQSGSGNSRTGYCSHSSGIFPTWHRAYVSMIEVRLAYRC